MTLMIDLTPEEEARLRSAARRDGVDPVELARKLVTDNLPAAPAGPRGEDPTLALFRQWEEEDANMTSEELEDAQRELDEFKEHLNEERRRAGMRILYP